MGWHVESTLLRAMRQRTVTEVLPFVVLCQACDGVLSGLPRCACVRVQYANGTAVMALAEAATRVSTGILHRMAQERCGCGAVPAVCAACRTTSSMLGHF